MMDPMDACMHALKGRYRWWLGLCDCFRVIELFFSKYPRELDFLICSLPCFPPSYRHSSPSPASNDNNVTFDTVRPMGLPPKTHWEPSCSQETDPGLVLCAVPARSVLDKTLGARQATKDV